MSGFFSHNRSAIQCLLLIVEVVAELWFYSVGKLWGERPVMQSVQEQILQVFGECKCSSIPGNH